MPVGVNTVPSEEQLQLWTRQLAEPLVEITEAPPLLAS
jgi:hypothetical protein